MKNKRLILSILTAVLIAAPVWAVFNEEDLGLTLSELRFELKQEILKRSKSKNKMDGRNKAQHARMIKMIKTCNELSLMLYSQKQDCTFDMTYALKEVTRQYEAFNENKVPYDDIVARLNLEIDRYSRLIKALERLPVRMKSSKSQARMDESRSEVDEAESPDTTRTSILQAIFKKSEENTPFFLDKESQVDRDSCIFYATELLNMYTGLRESIVKDSEFYDKTQERLKESYDYANERYKVLQKRIFTQPQTGYFLILRTFPSFAGRAFDDCRTRYARTFNNDDSISKSEWRGPVVVGFMGLVTIYIAASTLLGMILVSLLRRKSKWLRDPEDFKRLRRSLSLLCAMLFFAISVSIAASKVDGNFFSVASELLLLLSWLYVAILVSAIVRLEHGPLREALSLKMPIIAMGLVVVSFRIVFIPNNMMNLVLPPVLLGASIWQCAIFKKNGAKADKEDRILGWINIAVLGASTIIAWSGYVFISIIFVIWWLFQIAAVETVMACKVLLKHYFELRIKKRMAQHKLGFGHSFNGVKGEHIRVTWFYDLCNMALLPVFAILSVPGCMWLAMDVFDLTEVFGKIFTTPFFDLTDKEGSEILRLSFRKLVQVSSLFFIFRYISYLIKASYRDVKLNKAIKENGGNYVHTNEVNLTLANNLISIIVWGIYIIVVIILLKIPTGALSIVAAGLATGIGLAMKDILNNFIYGLQLMSGRLRVGDWLECDGVRGKVTSISYQSTQIETTDGAVMSFLNTALFNKNFKNLTRNNAYEFVKIVFGVSYGTDVDKVREVILDAMEQINTRDKYGRNIVDAKRGTKLVFESFGDSSVNVAVKQYVLVSENITYAAKAREVIYNALNENGIEIPFPQVDIHNR